MKYCSKCGKELDDDAVFCSKCGHKVDNANGNEQKETVFNGELQMCPRCGCAIPSFVTVCPMCDTEIRGVKCSKAIDNFYNQISQCNYEAKMVNIIRTSPIPNTKEDLFEFLMIAKVNIKRCDKNGDGVLSDNEKEVLNAWLTRLDLCYEKGKIILTSSKDLKYLEETCADLESIIEDYNKKEKISKARKAFFESNMKYVVLVFAAIASIVLMTDIVSVNILGIIFSGLSLVAAVFSFLFAIYFILYKNQMMTIIMLIISAIFSISAIAVSI